MLKITEVSKRTFQTLEPFNQIRIVLTTFVERWARRIWTDWTEYQKANSGKGKNNNMDEIQPINFHEQSEAHINETV